MLSHDEIIQLTHEYGGDWGLDHTRRLLHLVPILADRKDYNQEAVWIAAHLHDWGGFSKWMVPGVEHYDRSAQIARKFLIEQDCPEELVNLIEECIRYHHGGDPRRSFESILLTDADALDLLGVVGTLRIFALNPRDIRKGYKAALMWRERELAAICLDTTRELAKERVQESDYLIKKFEEETFGIF